jgi:hypothetical protein
MMLVEIPSKVCAPRRGVDTLLLSLKNFNATTLV